MNNEDLSNRVKNSTEQSQSKYSLDTQLDKWALTKSDVDSIEDSEMIYPNTIAKSKHTIVVADSGGGKTTIFLAVAAYLASLGFDVSYFDYDSAQDDMKKYALFAKEHGFKYITETKTNLEGHMLVSELLEMVKEVPQETASNQVFFFDTMRMFTLDLDPKQTTKFLLGVRKLTQYGVTCTTLHHNNKRPEMDGSGMFAGLNNIKTNCDNLIYLSAQFHDDGSMTVSSNTNPPQAKRRSDTKNMSWSIKDRIAIPLENFVPIISIPEDDQSIIAKIKDLLIKHGELNESHLRHLVLQEKITGRRALKRILTTYRGEEFDYRVGNKNAHIYSIKT